MFQWQQDVLQISICSCKLVSHQKMSRGVSVTVNYCNTCMHCSYLTPHGYAGDVRLSEVRKALGEAGITADWHGGMLVCSGMVTIKVGNQDGQVKLEGSLCDDYFRIRDVVYGQYHVC